MHKNVNNFSDKQYLKKNQQAIKNPSVWLQAHNFKYVLLIFVTGHLNIPNRRFCFTLAGWNKEDNANRTLIFMRKNNIIYTTYTNIIYITRVYNYFTIIVFNFQIKSNFSHSPGFCLHFPPHCPNRCPLQWKMLCGLPGCF